MCASEVESAAVKLSVSPCMQRVECLPFCKWMLSEHMLAVWKVGQRVRALLPEVLCVQMSLNVVKQVRMLVRWLSSAYSSNRNSCCFCSCTCTFGCQWTCACTGQTLDRHWSHPGQANAKQAGKPTAASSQTLQMTVFGDSFTDDDRNADVLKSADANQLLSPMLSVPPDSKASPASSRLASSSQSTADAVTYTVSCDPMTAETSCVSSQANAAAESASQKCDSLLVAQLLQLLEMF